MKSAAEKVKVAKKQKAKVFKFGRNDERMRAFATKRARGEVRKPYRDKSEWGRVSEDVWWIALRIRCEKVRRIERSGVRDSVTRLRATQVIRRICVGISRRLVGVR